MPSLDGHELTRCLPRRDKFWAILEKTGGDDKWKIAVNGRPIAWTQMSRSNSKTRTIDASRASSMARQLKIPVALLGEIIGCRKGWRDYILSLYANNHIEIETVRAALELGPNAPIPAE